MRCSPPEASYFYLPLVASMQALDSIEDKARALQGKGKVEQGKGTAAKRKEIEDAVLSAFGHTDRNLTEICDRDLGHGGAPKGV